MRTLYIKIVDDQDRTHLDTLCGTVQAIAHLQDVIARLRAEAAPTYDCSWGEQPMPILGPSAEELAQRLAQTGGAPS